MASSTPGKLVIRAHAPLRRWLLGGGAAVALLIGLYIVYELGRFDAGYDRQAAAQMRTEQQVERERLEAENRELRVRIAGYETTRVGASREHSEVARTIGDLQAQVARQTQELAFLRGIVQQTSAAAPSDAEVKVQDLRIAATGTPGRFQVRLNLVQVMRAEKPVNGAVDVRVEGLARDGQPANLALTDMTGGKRLELPFSFRYFQRFDEAIALPAGFRPQRVTVALRSSHKGVAPVTQTFPWTVDAA